MVILWGLRVTKPLVVSSLKTLCNNEAFFNNSDLWGSGLSSSQHVFLHIYFKEISHLLATQTTPFFIQRHHKWRLKSQYLPEAVPKVSKTWRLSMTFGWFVDGGCWECSLCHFKCHVAYVYETLGLGMNWVRLNQIRTALVDKTCLWNWMYAKYFPLT